MDAINKDAAADEDTGMADDALPEPIEITVFEKADNEEGEMQPLSKVISLGEDGKPDIGSGSCWMSTGRARRLTLTSLSTFANHLNQMPINRAIALGVFDPSHADGKGVVQILSRRAMKGEVKRNTITRTKANFTFNHGHPGMLVIDFDKKGMPPEVAARIAAAGGVWELLVQTFPALGRVGRVERASTSAGLYNKETGERFAGSGGSHFYIPVQDAGDIGRATQALHQRCWLAGLGWHMISSSGAVLVRGIIDRSVALPERLIFEGGPVLVAPMAQDAEARKAIAHPGPLLDSHTVLPNLSATEREELARLQGPLKEAKAREAAPIREAVDLRMAREMAARNGQPESVALEAVRMRRRGYLKPDMELKFDDPGLGKLGWVTVADILRDPAGYEGETLADPIEPDYGTCKAIVFAPDAFGRVTIHSIAHGTSALFRLQYNRELASELLSAAKPEDVVKLLCTILAQPHGLDADVEAELVDIAANKAPAGVGKRAITKRLKAQESRRRAEARAQAAKDNTGGKRPRIAAAPHDGEFLPAMRNVEWALLDVEDPEPPFRNLDGRYSIVTERSPSGLHQLVSDEKDGGENAPDPIPAPPEPLLHECTATELAIDVEKYVEHYTIKEVDGARVEFSVQFPSTFARAYTGWRDSALPRVGGVVTMPIVLEGTEIIAASGLVADMGLIFRIPQSVTKYLPAPGEVTEDYAAAAYAWLVDEWLADVDTNDEGKATSIAIALTALQRHLLPARPAFFICASQRGGGKTTLANMITMAVSGRQAAAASWANTSEERRKAIFSYLRAGVSMICWDNIERGAEIQDATLEKALTLPEVSDRILGESEMATVPSTTLHLFTGNNIAPRGDMTSRSLTVNINVNRADPENRIFRHPDIVEWTQVNRAKILNCLYAILLMPRAKPARDVGRFKQWYRAIGHPLELLQDKIGRTSISYDEQFKRSELNDPETTAITSVYAWLLDKFPGREFTASQVAHEMQLPPKPDPHFAGQPALDAWTDQRDSITEFRDYMNRASCGEELKFQPSAVLIGNKFRALKGRPVDMQFGDPASNNTKTIRLVDLGKKSPRAGSTWALKEVGGEK